MTNIVVPELGESIVEARVARWLKKEGDRVEMGDPLVELETEKVNLEVNAERGGVIRSIKRKEGEDVKIGEMLGEVDESAAAAKPSDSAASAAPAAKPSPAPVAPAAATVAASVPPAPAAPPAKEDGARAAPASAPAASLPTPPPPAASAPAPPPSPAPASAPAGRGREEVRQRMTKRRATIARRLVEAQHNAAMLTTFNEVDMTAVMGLRERHKEAFKQQFGVGLGIASFFVKVSVAVLRAFPQLNAEIQGDEIVLKRYYDIGIAVGAEGGLVVPVLRDADRMSFAKIELAIRDYAKRAADGTLTLQDLAGGTFTITNGGVFGSLLSTPILNPPQVGILGLHKIQDRPVGVNGQVVLRQMMYVALSYDHRIVDGREAVQFLVKIKELIEDPAQLLLET
jgi:2-oxoglutarate dehydrogenase E2 component (dihydrolipoamide succinyltransferase)